MTDAPISIVREPGPNEMRDPVQRHELRRAAVWFGLAIAVALVVLLIEPLLIIFGGLVFASLLDGGARLIGKLVPMPRPLRIILLLLLTFAFVGSVFYLTGVEIAQQAKELRATLEVQFDNVTDWAARIGLLPNGDFSALARQAMGSIGRVTSFVGSALGAVTSFVMIVSLGLFISLEPRIYERGLQWMVPLDHRAEFAVTVARMAKTLRRLLAGRLAGMVFEGVLTWILLSFAGVPMAMLLGILTGMLAFIPNIGAFISGVLMVSVGFSAGVNQGLWALAVYFGVQNFDGYVLIPLIAKRTVDMPPALTLAAQVLASTLFGVLGLALADPMVALIKTWLERKSEVAAAQGIGGGDDPANLPPGDG